MWLKLVYKLISKEVLNKTLKTFACFPYKELENVIENNTNFIFSSDLNKL